MTLKLYYLPEDTTEGWTEYTDPVSDVTLTVRYDGADELTFNLHVAQHQRPISLKSRVRLVDDASHTVANPTFEGHAIDADPAESNVVSYTCADPTWRIQQELFATYLGLGPRVVFNASTNPADDDNSYCRANDQTVGEIIATLFDDHESTLADLFSTPDAGGDAYLPSDLDDLDFKPTEKVVFQGERLLDAVDRLLGYFPAVKRRFAPGATTRKIRFTDAIESPAVTLTLNQFGADHDVLAYQLDPSLANRYTAVYIAGPDKMIGEKFTWTAEGSSGDGLAECWTFWEQNTVYYNGPDDSYVGRRWQVIDEDKRRLAKIFPEHVLIPGMTQGGDVLGWGASKYPRLDARFDDEWRMLSGYEIDPANGFITLNEHALEMVTVSGERRWIAPDEIRFYGGYFTDGLAVRYPETGYAGSAYDDYGHAVEFKHHEELMTPEWEITWNDDAVTSESSSSSSSSGPVDNWAAFRKLAELLHKAFKDTAHVGGITIAGIDYEWLRLDRRVNVTAVDQDGTALTTGWESINAVITEVEYDYENDLTTLVVNGDNLEFMHGDVNSLKTLLKIKAKEWTTTFRILYKSDGVTRFDAKTTL